MNNNIPSAACLVPAAASILMAAGSMQLAAKPRPNILVIMCDDMGYGDLGCYGQPYISTPNIDSLARAGMRFTQAYAGSPVSAPSRASFMTGQHSGHCEIRGNREYWRNVDTVYYGRHPEPARVGQHPLDPGHVIMPEIMKANGYSTGMFGKWAGGYEGSPSTPDKRGIDEYYGFLCQFQAHLYYPNFLNRYMPRLGDTALVRVPMEGNIPYPMHGPGYEKRTQYSADLIHRQALDWLERRSPDEPFFGLLTYTLPHAELAQPADSLLQHYKDRFFEDRTWGGQRDSRYNPSEHTHAQFAAMISRLDTYVGEIMQLLRNKGMLDNTLVIFTSDNGPHEEGGADPAFFGRDGKLKGLKRSCHEGGIRVPFIACWPGHIAPGSESDHIMAFYDILPTLAEIAGEKKLARYTSDGNVEAAFDGISFVGELHGRPQRQHDFLYWEFEETDQIAVRSGQWKLIVKNGRPELYNLNDDIHEDNDLAPTRPDIVESLTDIIRREHRPSELFKVTLPL